MFHENNLKMMNLKNLRQLKINVQLTRTQIQVIEDACPKLTCVFYKKDNGADLTDAQAIFV